MSSRQLQGEGEGAHYSSDQVQPDNNTESTTTQEKAVAGDEDEDGMGGEQFHSNESDKLDCTSPPFKTEREGTDSGSSSATNNIQQGSTSGREKKLMAMIKQQKITIRKLENSIKQATLDSGRVNSKGPPLQTQAESLHKNSNNNIWSKVCPSLANRFDNHDNKLAQCALSSLVLPIQRLHGFNSCLLKDAFFIWKEGGPQPTMEQMMSKQVRLKQLLGRSSAVGNKLKEENDMLRASGKQKINELMTQIATLKVEMIVDPSLPPISFFF
jgi:hypothetical protein